MNDAQQLEQLLLYYPFTANYEKKTTVVFYGKAIVAAGATVSLLKWNTDRRAGAINSFIFGFSNFTPPTGSYDVTLKLDNQILPRTGQGQIFSYENFLSEEVKYFQSFDSSGAHLFELSITNLGIVNIYPQIVLNGFYTT